MNSKVRSCVGAAAWALLCASSHAAPVYLNGSNITVGLGPGMAAEPFANRSAAASLASVIDAPTAASPEFHNQSTHVWVSGGILDLRFDLGVEYDLTTLHFWNYHSEGFDVDNIDFTFFDANGNQVGALTGVAPLLGNNSGSDANPILAQDYVLSFPSKVRFVTAVLSGSNGQVDFNNIGFTGQLTDPNPNPNPNGVPIPSSAWLVAAALLGLRQMRRRA